MNNPFYSYNSFRNYNKGVGGVFYPRPDTKIQNKMLINPKNFISYSYKLKPTCNGYYKIDGSCSN